MRKVSASEIALSALSCALATTFLTVGVYSGVLVFTAYLAGSIVLMLPLCQKSWRGYICAYIATCLLTVLFASSFFWDLIPFIIFFGLHPFVNELQLKTKINRWLACFIKAIWFDGTVYFTWKVLISMTTAVTISDAYVIPIILVVGTGVFIGYDYFMFKWRSWASNLVRRISKK
ncbi:MAG: hypothetical protein E7368_04875 [Clostridiales bacterium]|nr:hypothetical protein [Clostridiales bacterium]